MDDKRSLKANKKKKARKMGRGLRFMNDPKHFVAESLEGYIIGSPGIVMLSGHNVIVRADCRSIKDDQVAVICGGGSGHEPAFAGYVGKSWLTAAVCGEVFSSPTAEDILAAIRAVTGVKGCAVIIMNYTGDRLHFGSAIEKANAEGLNARIIAVVADDCALPREKGITGRRGVAGTILALKVACAAAADGATLDEIQKETNEAIESMSSMGCALSACTLPGEPVNSRLMGSNRMEFGLGIHGEAGTEVIESVLPANDVVDKLMEAITGPPNNYLPLDANARVAILINSLGATTGPELNILLRRAMDWLHQRDITVERCCAGHFLTSLDMAGASITVMKVDDQRLSRLVADCDCSAWPNGTLKKPILEHNRVEYDQSPKRHKTSKCENICQVSATPLQPTRCREKMESVIRNAAEAICEVEPQLTQLDTIAGDGDCGRNFKAAAEQIIEALDNGVFSCPTIDDIYLTQFVLEHCVNHMGGTCGALLQIFFNECASCLSRGDAWPNVVEHGVQKIMLHGGASVGMKTLLDAVVPFSKALNAGKGLKAAAAAARAGAESTKGMKALAGRSNYVLSSANVADAGAVAVACIISSIAELLDP